MIVSNWVNVGVLVVGVMLMLLSSPRVELTSSRSGAKWSQLDLKSWASTDNGGARDVGFYFLLNRFMCHTKHTHTLHTSSLILFTLQSTAVRSVVGSDLLPIATRFPAFSIVPVNWRIVPTKMVFSPVPIATLSYMFPACHILSQLSKEL